MRNLLAFDTGLGRKKMAWPQYAKNSKGGDLAVTAEKLDCAACFSAFSCKLLKLAWDTYIFLLSTEQVSFGCLTQPGH